EERYVFDPHGRTTVIRLELVQLHQGDILRRLQERGLLPMQQELPLSATAPNKLAEPTIAQAKRWQPEEASKSSVEQVDINVPPVAASPSVGQTSEPPESPVTDVSGSLNPEWPSAEQLEITKASGQKRILEAWPRLCRQHPLRYSADKVH